MEQTTWLKAGFVVVLILLASSLFVFSLKYRVAAVAEEPNIVQIEQASSTLPLQQRLNLPAIIKRWHPAVSRVDCYFRDAADRVYVQTGSGFFKELEGDLRILTNRHVLRNEDNLADKPELCEVSLPGVADSYLANSNALPGAVSDLHFSTSTLDWGYITMHYSVGGFVAGLSKTLELCTELQSLGTPVVILGYPAVGAKNDITVTQGIVAGYDGDYYITDAKIGHGSSGGVALGVDIETGRSCYMGIPTYAETGEVISLGRILDINSIQGW